MGEKKQINQTRYYNDGITRITDAFWTVRCPDCGHVNWSLTYGWVCPVCRSVNAVYTNPTVKISPSS
jgi:ribosomal protein S27E